MIRTSTSRFKSSLNLSPSLVEDEPAVVVVVPLPVVVAWLAAELIGATVPLLEVFAGEDRLELAKPFLL